MEYLVTGASGFAGRHLMRELAERGWPATGVVRQAGSLADEPGREVVADLTDRPAFIKAVADTRPDGIFHLAAPETSVRESLKDPDRVIRGNLETTLTVLEVARHAEPSPRVFVVSSGEVYGKFPAESLPLTESTPLNPDNPYGESKARVEAAAHDYSAKGVPIIIARSFNHIGPGQSGKFALANFAQQIARLEAAGGGELKVGNLAAKRDFTDVRDVVASYVLLMQQGEPGETYNVGSGEPRSVGELLELLLEMSPATIDVVVDPERFRPNEVELVQSDTTKLRKLGWQPKILLDQTLYDILDDARQRHDNQGEHG